jgi:NAD(P)-dependent dehydrogenase (short-subunit alcohol dehydrogenase family)
MGDRLKGKVAVVTGAGTVSGPEGLESVGNGRAAAITYANEGASVLAADIDKPAVNETMYQIRAQGGICTVFQADVSKADDCRCMVEESSSLRAD